MRVHRVYGLNVWKPNGKGGVIAEPRLTRSNHWWYDELPN